MVSRSCWESRSQAEDQGFYRFSFSDSLKLVVEFAGRIRASVVVLIGLLDLAGFDCILQPWPEQHAGEQEDCTKCNRRGIEAWD